MEENYEKVVAYPAVRAQIVPHRLFLLKDYLITILYAFSDLNNCSFLESHLSMKYQLPALMQSLFKYDFHHSNHIIILTNNTSSSSPGAELLSLKANSSCQNHYVGHQCKSLLFLPALGQSFHGINKDLDL